MALSNCSLNGRFSSVQFSSVAQSCLTLCDPMDCSTPGFPVHHQLPEPTQTHVHRVSHAIQPSHPLVTFSFHLQSFPASGSFPVSWFFVLGGQSIEVSASASVLSMNIQDWFPLGLISLQVAPPCSSRDSQESSLTPQFKSINSLALSLLHSPTLTSIHDHWKNHSLARQTFVGKVMSLLLNMLSMFLITFFPRSKSLLISWLQSPSAVILSPKK